MATQRLPIPGSDNGTWGSILNGFLEVSHNQDGTLLPSAVTAAGAASLSSPSFTGTPTAPTASLGTNTTQLATTAFTTSAVGALSGQYVPVSSRSSGLLFTPEQYGAVGNGTTDDTADVQAMITAAGVGGTCYFSQTYLISSALTPLAEQWWYGPGTLKLAANTSSNIIHAFALTGLQIGPGLTLDGNRANQTAGSGNGLLYFQGGTACHVNDITIQNAFGGTSFQGTPGLLFRATNFCSVTRSRFIACGYGILLGQFSNDVGPMYGNKIDDCFIENSDYDSIFLSENLSSIAITTTVAVGSNAVNVNTFTQASPGTLNVGSTTNFPTTGTVVVPVGSGGAYSPVVITYTGTTSTTFTGCVTRDIVTGTLSTGGLVSGVNGYLKGSTISNCHIIGAGDQSIELGSGTSGVTLSNCVVEMPTSSIAAASGGIDVATFTGSGVLSVTSTAQFRTAGKGLAGGTLTVQTQSGKAIITYTGTTNTTFTGCTTAAGGVASGVMALGASVWESTGQAGVLVRDAADVNISSVTARNLVRPSAAGVSLLNLNGMNLDVTIASCTSDTMDGGIYDQSGTQGLTITDCIVDKFAVWTSAFWGIHLHGTTYFSVTNTSILRGQGTSAAGIYLDGSQYGSVGNNFVGSSTLLYCVWVLHSAKSISITGNTFQTTNTGQYCVNIADSSETYILVSDNIFQGVAATFINVPATPGAGVTVRNNPGLNPIGAQTVAVPATTVAVTAVVYDRTYYVTNGSASTTLAISNGPTITLPASAVMPVRVPAGTTLTPTYTVAPTWVVETE